MSIEYDIRSIPDPQGEGKDHKYVHLTDHTPMNARQLAAYIQGRCSLTKGDVQATLSALRDCMARELASGNRFYIPEVGYFSLSAGMDLPEGQGTDRVKGYNVHVRNINFRPEASLLKELKQATRFERARTPARSKAYTEEELLKKADEYIAAHGCLTRRALETDFGLLEYTARKWLKHLVETGRLKKEGTRNSPVYLPAH